MITTYHKPIPVITTEQMIEVDRLMIEVYHIQLIQMMENAGRCLAILAKEVFLQNQVTAKVTVLAGIGGNGGGAMVCARILANWGYDVAVCISSQEKMTPVPAHQLDILRRMNVTLSEELPQHREPDLIVDGVVGYSIQGDPRGKVKEMIEWINASPSPVVSLDTPSGVDLTSGVVHRPSVRADATLTLALPKRGLFDPAVKDIRGTLYLGDLSVPPQLYNERSLGIEVNPDIFRDSDVVRVSADL